jgi:hypothetical protein
VVGVHGEKGPPAAVLLKQCPAEPSTLQCSYGGAGIRKASQVPEDLISKYHTAVSGQNNVNTAAFEHTSASENTKFAEEVQHCRCTAALHCKSGALAAARVLHSQGVVERGAAPFVGKAFTFAAN